MIYVIWHLKFNIWHWTSHCLLILSELWHFPLKPYTGQKPSDVWHLKYDNWHLTSDIWYLTYGIWPLVTIHLTFDICHLIIVFMDIHSLAKEVHFGDWMLKTGFQFIANKQFSMEKKDWEHQFVLISQNILLKTNTFNLYRKNHLTHYFWMEILLFFKFLKQIWLPKTVFWTNLKKRFYQSNVYMLHKLGNLLWHCNM